MGIGGRLYLVSETDSLQRFSLKRFERLHDEGSKDRVPEFAGRPIRYALVSLETRDRKPFRVRHIEFGIAVFDSNGRLDRQVLGEKAHDAVGRLEEPIQRTGSLIRAERLFTRHAFQRRYTWEPSDEMMEALREAVFGRA